MARFSPAKPKAGKVFRVTTTTVELDDGTEVKPDSIRCVARLAGIPSGGQLLLADREVREA